MGRKSISMRIRRATTTERKMELLLEWIDDWEADQTTLTRKLLHGIQSVDFDNCCIACGALREITRKRFDGLYNSLSLIYGEEYDVSTTWIYRWGKEQTGNVAKAGRFLADRGYTESEKIATELQKSAIENFAKLRTTLHQHAPQSTIS